MWKKKQKKERFEISSNTRDVAQEMNHPVCSSQAHKTRRVYINFLGSVVAGPTR